MEGAEMESKEQARKSKIAIRCAKAAIMLSYLKSSPNRSLNHDQEREMLKREIGDLKMELVRERLKSKRIRLCGLMELILQVMLVLSLSTILSVLVFMCS